MVPTRQRKSNFAIQFRAGRPDLVLGVTVILSIALMQNSRTVGAGARGRTEIFIVCREKAGRDTGSGSGSGGCECVEGDDTLRQESEETGPWHSGTQRGRVLAPTDVI